MTRSTRGHPGGADPSDRRRRLSVGLLLAAATLTAHGASLGDGLFLDDHWHQSRLADIGWTPADWLHATTLEPARFIETWWQDKPAVWQYARPVSVLLMKVVHALTGGSAVAQHAVSLLLHFLAACMVTRLCWLLTRNRSWSVVGGLLFVVYSHSVFAVGWLAAQNAVLQTALMLGALLAYIRASGLDPGPEVSCAPLPGGPRDPVRAGSELTRAHPLTAATAPGTSWADTPRPVSCSLPARKTAGWKPVPPILQRTPNLRPWALVWTLVLWGLALFSRENAIMFPAIMAGFDLAFGGRRHLWARRWVYLTVGIIAAAFLYWRMVVFYVPMPDVYVRRPDGNGYVAWCAIKLMHYLCSAVWLSPMTIGPSGRLDPLAAVPGDCALMAGILTVMGLGYYFACRRVRGYWIWPMWLLLSVLPVVPVLATPHSGYLCGVGFAVGMVLGPGLGARARPTGIGRWSKAVAVWFLVATCIYIPIYRLLWRAMIASERVTMASLEADDPPDGPTDVFFLNLPFVNIYAPVCLKEAWGGAMAGVRCHVLTYAPDLLLMDDDCVLTRVDDYEFSIRVAGKPYFSGLLGRFLIDGLRKDGVFREGRVLTNDRFEVRVDRVEPGGVRALSFRFPEPLSSPAYRFYMTTPACPAVRLRFTDRSSEAARAGAVEIDRAGDQNVESAARRLMDGEAHAAGILFDAMESSDPAPRDRAWASFRRVAAPVARATGSALAGILARDDPPTDVTPLRRWWSGRVDDRVVRRVWVHRRDALEGAWARSELLRVRTMAARVIRTDLYLTGPPYPGPAWSTPR